MTYNRCVELDTVQIMTIQSRRFNWFKYSENEKFDFHMNDELGKMVLNPDVVVRGRVLLKNVVCVSKKFKVKLTAKEKEDR